MLSSVLDGFITSQQFLLGHAPMAFCHLNWRPLFTCSEIRPKQDWNRHTPSISLGYFIPYTQLPSTYQIYLTIHLFHRDQFFGARRMNSHHRVEILLCRSHLNRHTKSLENLRAS